MAAPEDEEKPSGPYAQVLVAGINGEDIAHLDVNVTDTVESLRKMVASKMELGYLNVYDLLRDGVALPSSAILSDAGIFPDETNHLIAVRRELAHFMLDDTKKGRGIVLSEEGNGLVTNETQHACGYDPASDHTILAKEPLPEGTHHFRVRLVQGTYYYIGVAEKCVDLNHWLGGRPHGWAYYIRDNASRSATSRVNGGPGSDFGIRLQAGESVTICVDTVAGTMYCARNDDSLKLAFSNLKDKELYVALGMGPNGVTLQLEDGW
eukprot:TRINITY_DN59092_c0_g1_i1.p1 TRINITY_DN59092_c0_g1~~TRINITY_DN59092_c0_g1_i1.p1  ORF type:complete len:265 (-),score=21.54 TRINITY_DN59092_c0_g1_i1:188-982(-)